MMHPVIIIGGGGHARALISVLKALRSEIIGILHPDTMLTGQIIEGIPILGNDDRVMEYAPDAIELVNGIGSILVPEKHKNIYMKFKNEGYSFAQVLHPSALIMKDVQMGEGSQIMAGAIIQTGCRIGNNAIINTGAIVEHDCTIGDHAHVAPGAVISGGVQIGAMTHIGTSATVIQGINIGQNCLVGAGSVVINNIPPGIKVVGVPAREIED